MQVSVELESWICWPLLCKIIVKILSLLSSLFMKSTATDDKNLFLLLANSLFWPSSRLYEKYTLEWHHNGRDNSISNHQPHDCLFNRLCRHRSKKTSKLCITGLCAGNSPGTGEFPTQMASDAENVPIWWRYHAVFCFQMSHLREHGADVFNLGKNTEHFTATPHLLERSLFVRLWLYPMSGISYSIGLLCQSKATKILATPDIKCLCQTGWRQKSYFISMG